MRNVKGISDLRRLRNDRQRRLPGMSHAKSAAIVIAGGLSSRMGGFKPLLDIGGKPALFRLLDTIHDAGIARILVVMGYGHEKIEAAIAEKEAEADGGFVSKIDLIYNNAYESGMFSSVQVGIRSAATYEGDVLLFPVDVPLVKAETVSELIRASEYIQGDATGGMPPLVLNTFRTTNDRDFSPVCEHDDASLANSGQPAPDRRQTQAEVQSIASHYKEALSFAARAGKTSALSNRRPFAVPVFEGKNGHPLLIPREYFDEILAYDGEDGLKGVRGKYDANMIRYETTDAGCVLDMDTPEDYAKLLEYEKQQHAKSRQNAKAK